MSKGKRIVVGCGVSGLTTGVLLLEAGHEVEIITLAPPPETTSNVAAALWHPYAVTPTTRVRGWALETLAVFVELAADARTGVVLRPGRELFPRSTADAWWKDAVPGWRRPARGELPEGCADAHEASVPVIEMPIYLAWLLERFRGGGGQVVKRPVRSLEDPLALAEVVVNCTGLGARELVPDAEMSSARGQLVRMSQTGVERWHWEEDEQGVLTYVVPRSQDVVLGGTRERGREDLAPDDAASRAIIERCVAREPLLASARVLDEVVGLRPCRATVRVESESRRDGRLLVHNYGHGGAGVTLSWGCAREAAALAARGP